jgi:Arc/MetJ family transcription regulator
MATNLTLDQDLLDRAFRVSGEPTKKAAVTRALQEFIAQREQRRVAELFGKLDWDCAYDYNAERARKP